MCGKNIVRNSHMVKSSKSINISNFHTFFIFCCYLDDKLLLSVCYNMLFLKNYETIK